ncbi:ribosomal protein S18-alanine N-acetyltransferase [Lactobacillus psittaci]|uniref:ribosomal protein S18-alanine N-acetyltransferase n=1 Tax=Lactobacillus psittaci TaxID=116089 RepID=UPI0004821621|nr:ribosomal protein S18-alanine N-acetyltransferase [Lactobacillus psittaci]
MLKKFSHFFEKPAEVDLSFNPYVTQISGHTLQVMQASDSNISDLLKLEEKVYSGRTPWSSFSFASELRKWHNSVYLVIYEGSQLVGFVGGRFIPCEGHITNIAVDPAYQNQGIGTYLMKLMIDMARRNGANQVTLEVRVDNEKAQMLYRNLGFVDGFVRVGYYREDHVDGLEMILYLKGKKK